MLVPKWSSCISYLLNFLYYFWFLRIHFFLYKWNVFRKLWESMFFFIIIFFFTSSCCPWGRQHSSTCVLILGTDIRQDEILWTFLKVTTSCSIFRIFYSVKKCLYFTPTAGHFLARSEFSTSCQSTSFKEKFWLVDEFQRTYWKTVKPVFGNKVKICNTITLIEKSTVITSEKVLGTFLKLLHLIQIFWINHLKVQTSS